MFQLEFLVGSGYESKEIARKQLGLWEDCHIAFESFHKLGQQLFMASLNIGKVFLLMERFHINGRMLVRDNLLPVFRTQNGESHLGFEVGLVEDGENSVRVVGFKLGIQILFGIHIDEADTATPIVVILIPVPNRNRIFTFLQLVPIDKNEAFFRLKLDGMAIHNNLLNLLDLEVNGKLVRHSAQFELQLGYTGVVGAGFDTYVEVVEDCALLDVGGPELCSFFGQWHFKLF